MTYGALEIGGWLMSEQEYKDTPTQYELHDMVFSYERYIRDRKANDTNEDI